MIVRAHFKGDRIFGTTSKLIIVPFFAPLCLCWIDIDQEVKKNKNFKFKFSNITWACFGGIQGTGLLYNRM